MDEKVKSLIEQLDLENSEVGFKAIKELGELNAADAIPKLTDMLEDADCNIRAKVIWALDSIDRERAFALIIKGLKDDQDDYVRYVCAFLLGSSGKKDEAIKALMEALKDDYIDVRLTAAKSLGKLGNDEGYEISLNVLKNEDEEEETRDLAADALGAIGNRQALRFLEEYHEACPVSEAIEKLKKKDRS